MLCVMGWPARTVLFVAAALVTIALLRWRASARGRELPRLMESVGASWVALGRVVAGGEFLDQRRARRGMGPRGTLLVRGEVLEWRPDLYELKHGDQTYCWQLDEVTVLARRRRRDISGIRFSQVELKVPEGIVALGLFRSVGREPAGLQLAGKHQS
jgi:hypothetical protein